ncbi:MAG: hypothetical protein H7X80_01050, partial [bacterium]|nr:hypothetical protein [Candidatus Kapabacteria bacterium]
TVKSLTDVITVQLQLRNLLCPTTDLTIDAYPGQMLRAVLPTAVPVI